MIVTFMGRLGTTRAFVGMAAVAACLAPGCATGRGSAPTAAVPPSPALGLGVISVAPGATPFDYTSTVEEGDLIGGDAVRLVNAPLSDAIAVLSQPDALWNVMPRVVAMKRVGGTDDDQLIEVRHAIGPIEGGYTMRFVKQQADDSGFTVWFWVDTSRPRDLKFAWGTFRLMSFGPTRTLLAYQVRIELSPGMAKWLFSDRIRKAALAVADRARGLIEDRAPLLPGRIGPDAR